VNELVVRGLVCSTGTDINGGGLSGGLILHLDDSGSYLDTGRVLLSANLRLGSPFRRMEATLRWAVYMAIPVVRLRGISGGDVSGKLIPSFCVSDLSGLFLQMEPGWAGEYPI